MYRNIRPIRATLICWDPKGFNRVRKNPWLSKVPPDSLAPVCLTKRLPTHRRGGGSQYGTDWVAHSWRVLYSRFTRPNLTFPYPPSTVSPRFYLPFLLLSGSPPFSFCLPPYLAPSHLVRPPPPQSLRLVFHCPLTFLLLYLRRSFTSYSHSR
jgi:hypothetical protein